MASTALSYVYPEQMAQCLEDIVAFLVFNPIFFYIPHVNVHLVEQGEEDKGEKMERFAVQLAGLADVFVNDAFGSWQAHTSTYHVAKYLPSFAGLCMQVYLYFFLPCRYMYKCSYSISCLGDFILFLKT